MATEITPFSGNSNPQRLGLREGVAHGTVAITKFPKAATTLCGRKVVPLTTFGPEQWERFVEKSDRLGKTHEVGICRRCVVKSKEA